jgi:transcription antitermination factor NusG
MHPIAQDDPGAPWFAIHTRSRHEKQVAQHLLERQFTAFLPLRLEVHRWKDRMKKVEVPLFSGYLFVRYAGEPQLRLSILRTPGVVRIVGFGGKDEPVPAQQMESLRRVLDHDGLLHRHRFLRAGQCVRILSGAFAGVTGILKRVKSGHRLVINIEPLRQAVALEISGDEVAPLDA